MAQYYNLMTNASGTFTLEEVTRICTVDGQSVQLVVEDVNNGDNGSQQILTYTTAPQNSGQAILSQPTVNLGSQISTSQLEQGQSVFIIKTNQLTTSQGILKSTSGNVNTVGQNIANIVDNKGAKTLIGCNTSGQQIQWVKMEENSISVNAVSKQGALTSEKSANINKNQQNNTTLSTPLHGHCESPSLNPDNTKRKPLRLCQGRHRQSTNSIQTGTSLVSHDGINVTTTADTTPQNSNVSSTRTPLSLYRNKRISSVGQNVTPCSTQNSTVHARSSIKPLQMSKNTLRLQQLDMENSTESSKQTRLKQMQTSRAMQNDQKQTSNAQRLSNTPSQSALNNPVQRQQGANSAQQKQQASPMSPQLQKQTAAALQKSQCEQDSSPSSPPSEEMHNSMEIESSDSLSQEKGQGIPLQFISDNSSSQSVAYLQKMIDNPANTIVQHQIQGNTAKMLVMLSNGEQRLITFDIPNEDCTVQDLLEQANIVFCGTTSVSLVSDLTLGINYIVEAGAVTDSTHDLSESPQDNLNSSFDTSSQHISSPDENSNPMQQNEEPIYIEGMLAVCPHCGISSLDFNRCLRCRTKLPRTVKSIPVSMIAQAKKDTAQSVDTYKKNSERNSTGKLEKLEREGTPFKRGRGRGRGRGATLRSRPVPKEPECLTISSDEEEEGKNRKSESANNSTVSNDASNHSSEEMETIFEKEPVITNNSVSSTSCDYASENEDIFKGGGTESESNNFSDNSAQTLHTSLQCRTVRIGSYKFVPSERVLISHNGLRLGVPLLEDEKAFVTLDVKIQDIVKVLAHFGKAMPVLFVYTSTNAGAMIRELLGMQDPKGPYYDPAGKDRLHRRITLLPEILCDASKVVLKNVFGRKRLIEELNSKEANDILVRASPKDMSTYKKEMALSSALAHSNVNGGIKTITVYPPPPAKGGIAINTEDYLCLGEDQFLNDVIIDFYLKYLTLEVLSESDHSRTHVFSSYFYKRLTSPHAQAVDSSVPLSPAAKRHARVQKWTKNVNIFEKDFIIIPINEHAHWFLAIICFPGLVGKVTTNTTSVKQEDVHKTVQKSKKLKEVKLQAVTIGSTTITPVTTTITIDQADEGSERDEAEGDDEEMEMDSDDDDETAEASEESKIQQLKVELEQDTVKLPCILIFDSLAGASRARVVATLRDYLSCEHVAKMGSDKVFSKDNIKGSSLKVPQQSNFTDCGLYLLQYVESFFKNPIKNYTLPIKTLKFWFEEIVVTRKREELSKLLINLMNSTKGDKNINIPAVNFPTQDGKLKAKPENHVDMKPTKPDIENKKKPMLDGESRLNNSLPTVTENAEPTNEVINRTTYQIIPYSPSASSNSTESISTELLTEPKTPQARSSSETMSYLKSKRIPRLMLRTENQDDSQAAKKHKGESFDSCK